MIFRPHYCARSVTDMAAQLNLVRPHHSQSGGIFGRMSAFKHGAAEAAPSKHPISWVKLNCARRRGSRHATRWMTEEGVGRQRWALGTEMTANSWAEVGPLRLPSGGLAKTLCHHMPQEK